MGGAVCMGQPQQKIMKLKPPINGEGEQIINNFDYEEFAFEKEENDGPSKVKAGGNPNKKGDNDENVTAEIKNEYYNNAKENKDKKKEDKIIEQGAKKDDQISQQQEEHEEEQQIDFRAPTKSKKMIANNDIPPIEENNQNKVIDNINNGNENVNNQHKLEKIVEETQPQKTESNNQKEVHADININNTNADNPTNNDKPDNQNKHSQFKRSKKDRFPDIYSVIPEKLLSTCDGNELLFISDLKKMININAKERVKYSDRFCMVTKDNFILYNSKENYITLKRPLAILPIDQITRVVLFKLNPRGSGYDHFYICFDKNSTTEIIYQQINTFFMNGGGTIGEDGILPEGEEGKEIGNPPKENEVLLMFKSENSELIKKWYVVLDYLIGITKSKGEERKEGEQQQQKREIQQI